jgi:hypothetical protein
MASWVGGLSQLIPGGEDTTLECLIQFSRNIVPVDELPSACNLGCSQVFRQDSEQLVLLSRGVLISSSSQGSKVTRKDLLSPVVQVGDLLLVGPVEVREKVKEVVVIGWASNNNTWLDFLFAVEAECKQVWTWFIDEGSDSAVLAFIDAAKTSWPLWDVAGFLFCGRGCWLRLNTALGNCQFAFPYRQMVGLPFSFLLALG